MARNSKGQFLPGNREGGAGESKRPGRARLQHQFLSDLADDWDAHGKEAIKVMRLEDPAGYVKAVASLMPRNVELEANLTAQTINEWLVGLSDSRIIEAARSHIKPVAHDSEPMPELPAPEMIPAKPPKK